MCAMMMPVFNCIESIFDKSSKFIPSTFDLSLQSYIFLLNIYYLRQLFNVICTKHVDCPVQ